MEVTNLNVGAIEAINGFRFKGVNMKASHLMSILLAVFLVFATEANSASTKRSAKSKHKKAHRGNHRGVKKMLKKFYKKQRRIRRRYKKLHLAGNVGLKVTQIGRGERENKSGLAAKSLLLRGANFSTQFSSLPPEIEKGLVERLKGVYLYTRMKNESSEAQISRCDKLAQNSMHNQDAQVFLSFENLRYHQVFSSLIRIVRYKIRSLKWGKRRALYKKWKTKRKHRRTKLSWRRFYRKFYRVKIGKKEIKKILKSVEGKFFTKGYLYINVDAGPVSCTSTNPEISAVEEVEEHEEKEHGKAKKND